MSQQTIRFTILLFFSFFLVVHSQLFRFIPDDSEIAKILRGNKSLGESISQYSEGLKEKVKESAQHVQLIWEDFQPTIDSMLVHFENIQSDLLNSEHAQYTQQQYEEARDNLLEALNRYYEYTKEKFETSKKILDHAAPQQFKDALNGFQVSASHFNEVIHTMDKVKDKAATHWERIKIRAHTGYETVKENLNEGVKKTKSLWERLTESLNNKFHEVFG